MNPVGPFGTKTGCHRKKGLGLPLTIIVCVVGWIVGWAVLGRARRVAELDAVDPVWDASRRYTVVVPARNEELSLPNLLDGLAEAGPGGPRIVVVDDHSDDRTAELAAGHPGVEVVTSPPLPDGWTGKSWACRTGAAAATTDMLVFLDADVRVGRDALDRVVTHCEDRGGLVSVQPWHETEQWYEQFSAMFNVLAVMGTAMGSPSGSTGAFGPVMATSRADYDAVGGHDSVRSEIVEDLALARRYRDHGRRVEVLAGRGDIRFRMYPDGVRQLLEGWTKNFAVGASTTRPARLLAIVWWITALGSAAIALGDGVRGKIPLAVGAVLYLAFVGQLAAMFRQVGRFGVLTAVVYPLPLAVFLCVFVRSLWRTLVRHSVTWRGREVSTIPPRG